MSNHENCYHCGLPNDPQQEFFTTILGQPRQLCCPGCHAVATAIVENGLESYYQFRTEPAEKGDDALDITLAKLAIYDQPELQEEFVYDEGKHKQIQLTIEGITCAACGWLIEKQLIKQAGIKQVAVNVAERRAVVTWESATISLSKILLTIKRIGYHAMPFQPDQHEQSFINEHKRYLKKVGLAGIMTMQVMMLMTGLYFDLFGNIGHETRQYFYWIALVLTTPVVFYSGSVFYLGAFKALAAKTVNMDVPVTIAVLGTYLAGIKSVLLEEGEVYFESICMFVFLLLLSRFLEHRARQKAAQVSANLMQHIPVTANQLDEKGNLTTQLAKSLSVGDKVLVKAGETVPIDGIIERGESRIDESMLTGEFAPVAKVAGDGVYGGTINQNGVLEVRVTATLKNALVNQIIRLQTSALINKPKIAQTADRFSKIFVSIVLVLSALTFGFWSYLGSEQAFWIMIAVLIATCPCALGLATPSALTCAMANLNSHGILIKRADALEQLTKIDTIALDKTGTLTKGAFSIEKQVFAPEIHESTALGIAHALETASEHPIASAFLSNTDFTARNVKVEPGKGLMGHVDGEVFYIGSPQWFAEVTGHTLVVLPLSPNVILFNEHQWLAAFVVSDELKEGTDTVIDELRARYAMCLLSGDTQKQVDKVARALNIQNAMGEMTPESKMAYMQDAQRDGSRVLMMGDGINDAPVLAQADVSVAVGNATDVARSAADVIFLNAELQGVQRVIGIAELTARKIKQNMAWALGYNVSILPFAVSGILHPWMAMVGMSLSSIIVVANSARLLKKDLL
ncbi:cadmium-translocating P-type ATPase [Alteromonas sediminis]|uniref:Cadmium-translocating P-type ATPase n=1 Tax=Alteromonas sediminis TaxID=2259342 RepID=A0A3N5Y2V7_9ALTE|nr:heavy metal translocating P-type ATPase [Alteromonas sediminis]RPJ67403.1 cadmium-translocating P-type ATPase [Alteromonas sediminis]